MSEKASVKVYEDINYFREEVEAIGSILIQQYNTLRDLWRTLYDPDRRTRGGYGRNLPMASKPASLSYKTVEKMRERIEDRIDSFVELQNQADRIQNLVCASILCVQSQIKVHSFRSHLCTIFERLPSLPVPASIVQTV